MSVNREPLSDFIRPGKRDLVSMLQINTRLLDLETRSQAYVESGEISTTLFPRELRNLTESQNFLKCELLTDS